MSKLTQFISFLLLVFFVSSTAHAITISEKIFRDRTKTKYRVIRISGPILPGDAAKFNQFIINKLSDTDVAATTVALNSEGGNVNESYGIANLIINNGWSTTVTPTAQCMSACVNIFIVGNIRYAYGTSIIGVHRASTMSQDTVSARSTSIDMVELFKRFNVPDSIRLHLIETPPDKIYILTKDELYMLTNDKEGFNETFAYDRIYKLIYGDFTY